jgi:L-lactate dehydrogenase complex protein LldE
VLGVSDLGAIFNEKVTYHPSCHAMRLLGVKEEPLTLLNHVKGMEYIDLPKKEDCCGFGGTFAVKMADMSEAMVCEKAAHIMETGAEVLVGTDMGCLMNIGGRLNKEGKQIRVLHLAQLLEEGVLKSESQS